MTVTNVREGNTIIGTSATNTISTTTSVSGQPRATELEDTIYGLGGNDTILGAGGGDIIDGGAGNDIDHRRPRRRRADRRHRRRSLRLHHRLRIHRGAPRPDHGFQPRPKGDKISLTSIDANVNQGGNQDFAFIGSNAFSGVAGQLRCEIIDGHTFISGDVNGDRVGGFPDRAERGAASGVDRLPALTGEGRRRDPRPLACARRRRCLPTP